MRAQITNNNSVGYKVMIEVCPNSFYHYGPLTGFATQEDAEKWVAKNYPNHKIMGA